MTNERAKKILDFLAKKSCKNNPIGGDSTFTIDWGVQGHLSIKHSFADCWHGRSNVVFNVVAMKKCKPKPIVDSFRPYEYAKVLKMLLDYSHRGFDIAEEHVLYDNIVVIPAYLKLEQVLIEMDLEEV